MFHCLTTKTSGFVQAIGLIPSYFAIHVIRRQTHFRRQLLTELREFHVEKAQCRSSFDRGFIEDWGVTMVCVCFLFVFCVFCVFFHFDHVVVPHIFAKY